MPNRIRAATLAKHGAIVAGTTTACDGQLEIQYGFALLYLKVSVQMWRLKYGHVTVYRKNER
jgi:hypothetical protein